LKAGTTIVSDPYSFDTDTDPAFCLNPDPIRMQGFADQKFQILTAEKIFKFFMGSIYNFSITPYRISKLQKKPSALKIKHPALQNMKFLNFFLHCG
jgi:hypothetical protein